MFSKCSFAYIIAVEMITLEQWIPTNFAPRPIVATHYNRTNPKIWNSNKAKVIQLCT